MPARAKSPSVSYQVPKKRYTNAKSLYPEAVPIAPQANDPRLQVAEIMADEVGADRGATAAAMTRSVGRPVSVSMVNAWTRQSRQDKNLPAAYLAAWAEATGSHRLVEFVCGQLGLEPVDRRTAAWGRFMRRTVEDFRRLWMEVA